MLRAALSRVVLRTHRARWWVPALAALLLTVCGEPPSGPASGAERAVRLAFQPAFQQLDRALFQVASSGIDNVHLVLRDAVGTVVLDTIVAFPAGQDSVAIAATVLVRGESERFGVKFELRAGTQTMFEGTQELVARPGVNTPALTTVPLVFVGPGARAARVTVSPATSTLQAGSTVRLSAEVADAAGAPITDALLVWSSSNETSATVSGSGEVTALSARGTAVISATTLSGISGSATVRVTLPPSRVVVASGDGQTGTVGTALTQPLAVQVQASDGVGVGGVSVTFGATASGASVSPASATTDSLGRASASMTLGKLAGAQVFTATVAGLSAASVNAAAMRGDATVITITSGDAQADTAGRQLRQPLEVRVTDANGNAASGIGVTWSRISGGGAPSAATTTTDAQGQARVTYTLGNVPGTDVVRAAITAQPASRVEFSVTTRPRAPSRVVVVSGDDQSGTVGTTAPQPLVVRATDESGQAVPGVDIIWNKTNGAALSASSTTTDATGQSSVLVTYPTQPGTFTVSAQFATLSGASVGFSLSAIAGPATIISVTAGAGQSASGGATVTVAPAVLVTDRYGNVLAGVSVVFVAENGGSVTGSPATTDASGVATLGSWTLGPTAGTQTLAVSAGAISTTILATATVVATPPVLSVLQQPSASVANTLPFAVPPKVQLKTGAGAALKTAGITVTVALKTTGPALRGTLTATTDTAGVVTFNGLSLRGLRGNHVLMFTAPGYVGDTSKTFALTAGPAIGIFASSATTLSGVVGSVAAPTPKVLVTDSTDNPVSGVNVSFTVTDTAHGTVTGGATVTDTTGHASPGSWTLGHAVRTDTLSATAAGLVGSPVQFIATSTVGAATQLVSISGDAQTGVTGNPLASPMVVEARDAFSNPVAGVAIGFATLAGGSPATASVTTDAAGRAAFTLTLGAPGADTVKACLPSCATAQVYFGALSVPVGADAIWVGATSASWATAGNWSPAVVPGALNKVFIPAGRPFSPVLGGNVSVAELVMAAGASLDVGASQLALSGALLATGATMTGSTGYVYFCGGTHSFAGASFSMIVDCGATVSPAGTSTIAGGLTVQGGSVFDVGTSNVSVTGNVGMYGGARIKMVAAGGHLTVGGAYDSNPGNDVGDAWMTDGVLELKGDLTAASSCCSQSFRAVGAHVTRFSGSGPQTVNFYYTDNWSRSTFGTVEFAGNNTVTLANNMRVHGAVTVSGTSKVTGGTLYHGGQLTTGAGTDLSGLGYTQLNGGGAIFPLISGVGPGEVQIAGAMTVSLPQASITLPTNLTTHSGAVLDLEGKALTVTGNYGMYSSSRVKM
ncbi:MAG: Ig-like domain-containing protein, partial [Gemmatimonadaceae bacterium]